MTFLVRALVLLSVIVPAVPAAARWENPSDNKPNAVLERMDLNGLFNEAFDVCIGRAELAAVPKEDGDVDPAVFAAWDYLSVIEGYARDKSRGRLPEWMRALSFARTTKDCQAVFRNFVGGGDAAPETKPARSRPAVHHQPKARTKPRPRPQPAAVPHEKPPPAAAAPAAKPDHRPNVHITDELPPWLQQPKR